MDRSSTSGGLRALCLLASALLLATPGMSGGVCSDGTGFCDPIPCPAANSCVDDSSCDAGQVCEPFGEPGVPCQPSQCFCSPKGWICTDDCAPQCVDAPPSGPVPTASEWALIHFALLLLAGGTLLFGSRVRFAGADGSFAERLLEPWVHRPASLARTVVACLALMAGALAVAHSAGYAPSAVDLQGGLITAVLAGYLLRLWLGARDGTG